MRCTKFFAIPAMMLFAAVAAHASPVSLSLNGNLANPQSTYDLVFTVTGATDTVTVQTWGFGGGTNAAGTTINPGGLDPFVGIFSGIGAGATIVTENTNPAGASDATSNYTTGFGLPGGSGVSTFEGCAPSSTVLFSNGDNVCGDLTITVPLDAGTYTLVLSDGSNPADAIFDNGSLGEGFAGLAGSSFQTCDTNQTTNVQSCITTGGNWSFDLSDTTGGLSAAVSASEPDEFLQLILGLLALPGFGIFRTRRVAAHGRDNGRPRKSAASWRTPHARFCVFCRFWGVVWRSESVSRIRFEI